MATARARSSSRGRGSDELRSRRMGGVMETSREEFSSVLTRNPRKEASNVALTYLPNVQQKTPSRIPQTSSSRRPSTSTRRPPLTHESQSWSGSPNSRNISFTALASNGSASSEDHNAESQQPQRILRRKQSSVSRGRPSRPDNPRTDSGRTSSSSSIPRLHDSPTPLTLHLDRGVTESPADMDVVQTTELPKAVVQDTAIYPELDRYRGIRVPVDGPAGDVLFRLATHDLPPPTPLFSGTSSHSQLSSFSGSPSTRFSESPGTGPYSRDTTPTSISSASPGLVAPYRNVTPRMRHASPAETRPPVSRRRAGSGSIDKSATGTEAQGLAAVRETLTSSSSNSTVRAVDDKEDKLRRLLPPTPPNPPPRKSSQKLRKVREHVPSPTRTTQDKKKPVMRSPSPVKSPLLLRGGQKSLVASPPPRGAPPARPSREGTPDLAAQFGGPVPVIHSNLSTAKIIERRQSAQVAPSSLPRSATPSDHPGGVKAPVGREPTPAPRSASSTGFVPATTDHAKATRTPSPGVSTFRSRFGLFGRRTKTETSVPQIDKQDKPSRKGPAAGTGHEGYGRIGTVRRRSSNMGNPPRGLAGPVSSSESLASAQSTDPFLLERMNPVVIAGGEIIENRNTNSDLSRPESNLSLPFYRPSIDSRNPSSASLSSKDETRHTLWPSSFPRRSVQSRRPSDSSESEALTMKSTLAYRRSVQRLRSSPDQEPLRLPKPIVTESIASPSLGSIDTTVLTDDSFAGSQAESVRGRIEAPAGPKKLVKRAKSPRKWNLFSRSQDKASTSAKKKKKDESATVSATVKPVPSKPVPFYAMMDSSEQEDTGTQDMTTILREAEVLLPPPSLVQTHERRSSASSQGGDRLPRHPAESRGPAEEKTQPVVEPDQTKSPAKPVGSTRRPSGTAIARPSRLPQVGRIPKVVTTRPEQTSPKSFSRPFHRVSLQHPPSGADVVDQDSIAQGPDPSRPKTPELMPDGSTTATAESASPKHQPPSQAPEFLVFPPRNNSDFTTSTTSSSSGILSYIYQNAVVQEPRESIAEDEIWDEYNDLLGDVPPSATSSRGAPFHLETYESKLAKKVTKPLVSPTINVQAPGQEKPSRDSGDTDKVVTNSSHFSADMTARLNAAFRFSSDPPPSAPFSVSEFVSGYGDRNNSVELSQSADTSEHTSASSNKTDLAREIRVSYSSCSSEESPLSQVNLRVGSMTVSKWLTFGHVLFSPAREELLPVVGSLKRHSILVLDGLGNDDWSFYAAETYPAATFFNLSPRAPISAENRTPTSFPLSPPNHHQIQYLSHKEKLPFGPDSFTTVVFRFPSAAPESHYRNIISEARRVLKPGGYIELSILDVDLNNMGNRTRRGVRRLKERVHTQHPDFNLSSTADLILRLLAKKGFADVKTCRVGVPVASAVSKTTPPAEGGKRNKKRDERSLAEMMNDETEMGDENITKMVAKVGRWWYNRLYESAAASKSSIWNDKALLAECEEWGTSLKLMVCHARIPETRTRVSSI